MHMAMLWAGVLPSSFSCLPVVRARSVTLAMLWASVARLADEKINSQGSCRATNSWIKLLGWHYGVLVSWLFRQGKEHLLDKLIFL
eukprot:1814186-Rhodomonas_salina.1